MQIQECSISARRRSACLNPVYRSLVVSSFVVANTSPVLSVPAAPSENTVTAEVIGQDIADSATLKIEPWQALYRWKLRIAKKGPSISGMIGKTIKMRIGFRGESGGRYWRAGILEVK